MMSELRLFTSESVTEGHPDKICDQISDSILDAILTDDPRGRVAVETLVTTGLVHVAGEVSTSAYVEIPAIVRAVVNRIGYNSSDTGFDGSSCGVSISIGAQSSDIAAGVDKAFERREDGSEDPHDLQGAGDQGIMFGYATTETPQLMPVPIWIAHRLSERLAAVRKEGLVDYLRPVDAALPEGLDRRPPPRGRGARHPSRPRLRRADQCRPEGAHQPDGPLRD